MAGLTPSCLTRPRSRRAASSLCMWIPSLRNKLASTQATVPTSNCSDCLRPLGMDSPTRRRRVRCSSISLMRSTWYGAAVCFLNLSAWVCRVLWCACLRYTFFRCPFEWVRPGCGFVFLLLVSLKVPFLCLIYAIFIRMTSPRARPSLFMRTIRLYTRRGVTNVLFTIDFRGWAVCSCGPSNS